MDTRKLIAHIDGESGDEGRIEQDGYGILCSMTGAGGIDILPEIVKRWNAYPELVKRLEECADLLHASADEKAEAGSYGRDCHKAETKARTLLQTIKP